MAPCKMMKENARRMHGSARKNCKILHQSLILRFILHPILHPECPVNTKGFTGGCRKCSFFLKKNFFCRGGRGDGPEVAKHRTSFIESTDVLRKKCRCFNQRSPMFLFSEKGPDSPAHGKRLWRRLPCGTGHLPLRRYLPKKTHRPSVRSASLCLQPARIRRCRILQGSCSCAKGCTSARCR